ncbi:hypothetical protein F4782DRAFT_449300 [Xylaria castorea]|nr:hypothetical protein F4782DRAFT_449300 [Xylaria castorea]
MCRDFGHSYSAEKFSVLLKLGANIEARDPSGRSCLHICLFHLSLFPESGQYEAIKFLIRNGADINARNNDGETVHEVAYRQGHSSLGFLHHGSFNGDFWDAVLQDCGYEISKFRQGYQRRAVYVKYYTRRHFMQLWKGRESHCPYWNDDPWPAEAPWHPYTCETWCPSFKSYPDGYVRETNFGSGDRVIEETYSESGFQSTTDVAESENETHDEESHHGEAFPAEDGLVPSNTFDPPPDDAVEDWLGSIDSIGDDSSSQSVKHREGLNSRFYLNTDNPQFLALYQNPWSD